jgi:hypothetical protein
VYAVKGQQDTKPDQRVVKPSAKLQVINHRVWGGNTNMSVLQWVRR